MFSSRFTLAAVVAALAASVSADDVGLTVLSPGGSNLWWVANSINTLSWTCHSSTVQTFTVLVANSNQATLAQPQAIIAIENNFDCSKTITQQQEIFPAGTGYTIQLANPLNNTDVYAESQPFEIKPQGSTYPDASATPTESGAAASTASGSGSSGSGSGSSSATATGAAAAQSSSPSSGASGLQGSLAGVFVAAAGVLGLML